MAQATEKEREALRDANPQAWIPVKAGDKLEGVVTEVTRAWSDQRNGWYPLLRVQLKDGTVKGFHAFTTVLYNEVTEKQPLPGENIIVTYQGEGKAKPGHNAPRIFNIVMPDRDPRAQAQSVYARFNDRSGEPVNTAPDAVDPIEPAQEEIPF